MSLSTQESNEDDDKLFYAKMDNARTLANILKAIHFKETAMVFVSENGLKVTVEDAKCVQANAFIQVSLFAPFTLRAEQLSFSVNLTVLLDCLSIFGASTVPGVMTALTLSYGGYGHPLSLLLEEGGVLTDACIKTQEPEETLEFNFCSENVVNRIIMKSECLKEAFSELDMISEVPQILVSPDKPYLRLSTFGNILSECLKEAFSELDMTSEVLQILMSPDKPHLRLSTFGNAGSTHSDFPKDSDMVELSQCTRTQTNRYRLCLLKPSVKALMLSARVSLRTDDRGFLSMQYMIKLDDGQVCFVEYFCTPDEEVDND